MRIGIHILWGLAIVLILSTPLFAYYGGSGTAEDPYQIATAADWQQLMGATADWDKSFILMADIDLEGVTLTPVGSGYPSPGFSGTFDGNGRIIRNAVIKMPDEDYIGLFGWLDSGSVIRNLGVEKINISGSDYVGGLCGWNAGTINQCYTTGTVTAGVGGLWEGCTGGLCGFLGGTISHCYATGEVTGFVFVGGLCGRNDHGSILQSYATGAVTWVGDMDYVGGLCGQDFEDGVMIVGCFWNIQTSSQVTSKGGTGLTTLAMQNPDTYLRAFWDFVGEIRNGTADIWTMPAGGGYPILSWQVQRSLLPNDEMSGAISIGSNAAIAGTNIGATGLDLTANGYKDRLDVWYLLEPSQADKYTIQVQSVKMNPTVAVFDSDGIEIIFNDDFFGAKAAVILNADIGIKYYIRVAGYNGQTGDFTLSVSQGAVQAIQGDLNYDGQVDLSDLAIFSAHWLQG